MQWSASAARLAPTLYQAYFNAGVALLAQGDYYGAQSPLMQALLVKPDFLASRVHLALSSIGINRLAPDPLRVKALRFALEVSSLKNAAFVT